MASEMLLKAVAVTSRLMGTDFDDDMARMFCADLTGYPEGQVMNALARCRQEVRTRLTLADVLNRIDDGRPGPDEAFAMLPRDEAETTVWTREMRLAWDASRHGETEITRRQGFREKYMALVIEARRGHVPPQWEPSIGWDKNGRDGPLTAAVLAGRLALDAIRNDVSKPALLMLEARRTGGVALVAGDAA